MKPSVRQALREAHATSDVDRAYTMLTNLVRRLRDKHPGAASSLEEGLAETISVKRLRLPKKLASGRYAASEGSVVMACLAVPRLSLG